MEVIKPQAGPQEEFLTNPADIVIYGGAAGGGKTYGLLLENVRNINNPKFNSIIFRQNSKQVLAPGGLWDASHAIYPLMNAIPLKTPNPKWIFPSGATVSFHHLQMDKDVFKWQGAEIPLICFDELTHFSEYQFFYMLSRNRSTSGVKPYIRATCNPDVDSWVAEFIAWWIDQNTGYPIKERSGKIRYFIREDNKIIWGDTKEELAALGYNPDIMKSVAFIPSLLSDNKILMEKDPSYLANLNAMAMVEKERLLFGNWKIKPAAGNYFKRGQVTIIPEIPNDIEYVVRGWDLAATSDKESRESAKTAGVLLGRRSNGNVVVIDVRNERYGPGEVRSLIQNTAILDRNTYKNNYKIVIPQDPGQAGKDQVQSFIKLLFGFNVVGEVQTGDKVTRAEPFAAQWQAGNVEIVEAMWNKEYFEQLESFPESELKDMVDASGSAFNELARVKKNILPPVDSVVIGNKKGWNV